MARSVYICSTEGSAAKSSVALGVLESLTRSGAKVGVFRPITRAEDFDYVLEFLLEHTTAPLTYEEALGVTYHDIHLDAEAALETIVRRFHGVEAKCDAVVIVGSDYTDVGSSAEFNYNARIAANLGSPVLLVLNGRAGVRQGERLGQADPRSAGEIKQLTELALGELRTQHARLLALVVNRADENNLDEITREATVALSQFNLSDQPPVWTIPEDRFIIAPTMRAVMRETQATLIAGDEQLLGREALGVVVAGMSATNVLLRLSEGSVVVIPGDRTELLLAVLTAHASGSFPSISGVVLNGGFELPEPIERLLIGLRSPVPIVKTQMDTYETIINITRARGLLAAESQRKYDTALSLFERYIDVDTLLGLLKVDRRMIVTPLMLEYDLLDRARKTKKHIVLPEGSDDRILRAAATLLAHKVVEITILGQPSDVRARAVELGLDISSAQVVDPVTDALTHKFAEEYARLRAHKGPMSLEQATDTVTDVSYFGTMMVHMGLADGMVSGATHTTAHTIRPSFEIIKTQPGVSVVSSVFLMALADQVLVYGDCAVIPVPTAPQLSDIAISSAKTAKQFGIEPRVAMLSYSTGTSGSGADVDKVREATALLHERAPHLAVAGPIQYDAAADASVGAAKMPDSEVAGHATVFVFPDLNTGNNTYKAVQRSSGAVAIGPILQGLRKPINDLSRGATVKDIVNTVAITAIQADQVETYE